MHQRTLGTYPYSIIHLIVGAATLILMLCDSYNPTTTASEISTVREYISDSHMTSLGQLEKYYEVLSLVDSSTLVASVVRLNFQVVQLEEMPSSKWSMSFCHRVSFALAVVSATVTSGLNTSKPCLHFMLISLEHLSYRTETSAGS